MIERRDDRLLLSGAITFGDAVQWRESVLEQIDRDGLVIDLAAVSEADSAAVSLLLEWVREAAARGYAVRYADIEQPLREVGRVQVGQMVRKPVKLFGGLRSLFGGALWLILFERLQARTDRLGRLFHAPFGKFTGGVAFGKLLLQLLSLACGFSLSLGKTWRRTVRLLR